MSRRARPILIWDGDCRFCRFWVRRWAAVTGDREATVDKRDGVTPAVESAVPVETGPVGEDASIGNDKSVAVLPFANRSANEADVYFVDGIHDDILTQLARIGDLKVISRTSVEKFRGTTQSMGEIGEALGVQNILEGGVQRAGDRVRINVQLIDVETDEHLWAERFSRETPYVFDLVAEVANAIDAAINATPIEPQPGQAAGGLTGPVDPVAIDLFSLGLTNLDRFSRDGIRSAIDQFEQAVAIEPTVRPSRVVVNILLAKGAPRSRRSTKG